MFGRIFAPTSADAGTVKIGRRVVGVPLIVAVSMVAAEVGTTDALRPSAELVVVCPATRVRKEDTKKAAILKDESAMLARKRGPEKTQLDASISNDGWHV